MTYPSGKSRSGMGTFGFASLVLSLTLFQAACDRSPMEPANGEGGGSTQRSKAPLSPAAQSPPLQETDDDRFASLENVIPGFGGMYVDSEGALNVFLIDPSPGQAVRAAVDALRRAVPPGSPAREQAVRFRQGAYLFSTLLGWRKALDEQVFALGATFTDVDDATNSVLVGLRDGTEASAVRALADQIGIPDDALRTVVTGEPQISAAVPAGPGPSAAPHFDIHPLRERYRPLIGGLQIEWATDPDNTCTMTAPAFHTAHGRGILTASHCSGTPMGFDGATFHQNENHLGGTRIGEEAHDVGLFSGGSCPQGSQCRWSDATFVEIDDSVGYDLGFIALTADVFWGFGHWHRYISAHLQIQHSDPHQFCEIVYGTPCALVGAVVHKIGRSTDLTYGTIQNQCVNAPHPSGALLLCQDFADYADAPGDSGSPVFYCSAYNCIGVTEVELIGLHWGAWNAGQFAGLRIYSPMNGVREDLGVGSSASCSGIYLRPTTQFPC